MRRSTKREIINAAIDGCFYRRITKVFKSDRPVKGTVKAVICRAFLRELNFMAFGDLYQEAL